MANVSCGLKNSLCRNSKVDEVDDATDWIRRYTFVDQRRGLWSTSAVNDYPDVLSCPVGGIIVFYYPQGEHNIVELLSRNAYARCNLAEAVMLSPPTSGNSIFHDVSYYYHCTQPDKTAYLTSSVPGHCLAGQKIQIYTNGSEFAYDQALVPSDEEYWRLHVTSLTRLLRLLNWRKLETNDELVVMDHGYQTEELANTTAELIWCAMDHCPLLDGFMGSLEDCESTLYTLLGFVQRKRPIPLWKQAEEYYREALERGGTNECTAQSYLSMLFWTQGNYSMAVNETRRLCDFCLLNDPSSIAQAWAEWAELNKTVTFNESLQWDESCFVSERPPSFAPSMSLNPLNTAGPTFLPVPTMGTRPPSIVSIKTPFPTAVNKIDVASPILPFSDMPTQLSDQSSSFLSFGSIALWMIVAVWVRVI